MNSRVKDLVDMPLLLSQQDIDLMDCNHALHTVFKVRRTHQLPKKLLPPPVQWEVNFQKMAIECSLKPDMTDAYEQVDSFFQKVILVTEG